jgi:hypothetical protein
MAVPTVGWPANGNSAAGVKMRSRARCPDRLHLRRIEALRLEHDRERVAGEAALGEDIEGDEAAAHAGTPR